MKKENKALSTHVKVKDGAFLLHFQEGSCKIQVDGNWKDTVFELWNGELCNN